MEIPTKFINNKDIFERVYDDQMEIIYNKVDQYLKEAVIFSKLEEKLVCN